MAINFLNDGNFPDDAKLTFGTSGDLEIYHDGSNSYIKDAGTGNLWIQGSTQVNIGGANGEIGVQYVENAGVGLRHNNVQKLGTSSTGVSITGKQTISTIDEVGSDTDKFLMSDSGEIKYVTGANLRSYIGAGTGSGSMSSWIISADNAGTGTVDDGETVNIGGGTNITTSRTGNAITITNDITNNNQLTNGAGYTTNTGTITGSGVADRVAYWSSTSAVTYDNGFQYNGVTLGLKDSNSVLSIGSGGTGTTSLFAWTGDTFYIQNDAAAGAVQIETDSFIVKNYGAGETYIEATDNGSVDLYYNNSKKIETTTSGVDITGGFTTSASSSCAGLNMTSDIAMAGNTISLSSNSIIENDGNGGLVLNDSPTGSEGNGIIIKRHTTTTTAGYLYYLSHLAATWSTVIADNTGATRMLAIALGTSSATDGMLLQGIFRKAMHGFSAGSPLYVGSSTAGLLSSTPPTGNGDYARIVGYAIDSNTIYFNPSGTWVEVSA